MHQTAASQGIHVDDVVARKLGAAAHASGIFLPRKNNRPPAGPTSTGPTRAGAAAVVVPGPNGEPIAKGVTRWTSGTSDKRTESTPTHVDPETGSRVNPTRPQGSPEDNRPRLTPAQLNKRNEEKKSIGISGAIGGDKPGGVRGSGNIAPDIPSGGVTRIRIDGDNQPPLPENATDKQKSQRAKGTAKERASHRRAAEVAKAGGTAGEKLITEVTPVDKEGGRSITPSRYSPGQNPTVDSAMDVEKHISSRMAGGPGTEIGKVTGSDGGPKGATLKRDHIGTGATRLSPSQAEHRDNAKREQLIGERMSAYHQWRNADRANNKQDFQSWHNENHNDFKV